MTAKTPQVKNRFSPSEHQVTDPGEGRAQQQFKELCDLNHIMAKFEKTRTITHTAKTQPGYEYVPAVSLHEAMNITARANSLFEELPAKTRKFFENDPVSLMEFMENPENNAKAVELGLLPKSALQANKEPTATETPASGGASPAEPDAPPGETPET